VGKSTYGIMFGLISSCFPYLATMFLLIFLLIGLIVKWRFLVIFDVKGAPVYCKIWKTWKFLSFFMIFPPISLFSDSSIFRNFLPSNPHQLHFKYQIRSTNNRNKESTKGSCKNNREMNHWCERDPLNRWKIARKKNMNYQILSIYLEHQDRLHFSSISI
jgi:hypothetical protein